MAAAGTTAAGVAARRELAVDVVLPARDEEHVLPVALRSVRASIAAAEAVVSQRTRDRGLIAPSLLPTCLPGIQLPAVRLATRVIVVADRCTDRTAEVAARWADEVREYAACSTGDARHHGTRYTATHHGTGDPVARHGANGTVTTDRLLLMTDADSAVPLNWVLEHLKHLHDGASVVAGTVSVDDWSGRPIELRAAYERAYARSPHHVHGANLAVQGATYEAIGGFRSLDTSEDQDLVDRCLALGHRVDWCRSAAVTTSARRIARAPHGFAGYLNDLQASRSGG